MSVAVKMCAILIPVDDEVTLRVPLRHDAAAVMLPVLLLHRDDDIPITRQDMATPQDCCLVDSTLHRPVIKPDWFLTARLACGWSIDRHRPDERGKDEFGYQKDDIASQEWLMDEIELHERIEDDFGYQKDDFGYQKDDSAFHESIMDDIEFHESFEDDFASQGRIKHDNDCCYRGRFGSRPAENA